MPALHPRRLVLALCLSLLSFAAQAIDISRAWVETFQNSAQGGEFPVNFTVDSHGNVYIASTIYFQGLANYWIIRKLDINGQKLWTQSFFATGAPVDIVVDASGNAYVSGSDTSSAGHTEAVLAKFLSNGDFGWVRVYNQASGLALHLDNSGNVWMGMTMFTGANLHTGLIEYSSAGIALNFFENTNYAPGNCFFEPNGNFVSNGSVAGSNNPGFVVLSNTGTVVFEGSSTDTASDQYTFLMATDANSNTYIVVQDYHGFTTFTFVVGSYSPTGLLTWLAPQETGQPLGLSVGDSSHVYVHATVSGSGYYDFGFSGAGGGQRFMKAASSGGIIAADGTTGLVLGSANNPTFTFSEIDPSAQRLWIQSYTGSQPQACFKVLVVNGTVYGMNEDLNGTGTSTNVVKYVEGVGLSTLTVNANAIQGGNNVDLSVNLDDNAPAGGFPVTLSCDSAVLGVPASVTVPAGSNTLMIPVHSSPVDTSTPTLITGMANGVARLVAVTVKPATLTGLSFPGGANATVKGGQSIQGTIHLSGLSGLIGQTVNLSVGSPGTVPATVVVGPSASSGTFQLQTSAVAQNTTVTVNATLGSVTLHASVLVTP